MNVNSALEVIKLLIINYYYYIESSSKTLKNYSQKIWFLALKMYHYTDDVTTMFPVIIILATKSLGFVAKKNYFSCQNLLNIE